MVKDRVLCDPFDDHNQPFPILFGGCFEDLTKVGGYVACDKKAWLAALGEGGN